jgi:hypothetical protein
MAQRSSIQTIQCCCCCQLFFAAVAQIVVAVETNDFAALLLAAVLCATCSTRLEWIIIYLIVIEVIVGFLEILGLFGIVGEEH